MKGLLFLLLCSSHVIAADFIRHAIANPEGDAAYSFDASAFKNDCSHLSIGVFDSGIGGLTVMEALLTLDAFHNGTLKPGADGKPDFADERFIYFGDQANMPYGNYSSVERTDYLRELIVKDAVFLLGKRWFDPVSGSFRHDKPPVKAIVIACNTATAYGIEDIRSALKAWNLPVIVVGVVEAGARGVQEAHRDGAIGVLATVGTCASGAYPRIIGQTLGLAGRGIPVITQQGSANLAGIIEGDPSFKESIAERCGIDVLALVQSHLQGGARSPLSTIVLGCTHFPLAQSEIDAAFLRVRSRAGFNDLIAPKLTYVNPAEWTARELFRALASASLRAPRNSKATRDSFFISIPNPQRKDLPLTSDGSLEKTFKYSRLHGEFDRQDTVNVPMSPERIPITTRRLIETKLPQVWQRLNQ